MTASPLDPDHRAASSEVQASVASSPAAVRTLILSAWSNGHGTVLLSGAAGSGKTALLEQLASSLAGTGQRVRFVRHGDEVVLPDGAMILLVDEADRMWEGLLRRLLAHPTVFCVLAARPRAAQRIQAIGVTIPVVQLGGSLAAQPPSRPLLRLSPLRRPLLWLRPRPSATIAAGLGAVLVLASVVLWPQPLPPSERRVASLLRKDAVTASIPAAPPTFTAAASTIASGAADARTEAPASASAPPHDQPPSAASAVALAMIPSKPSSPDKPAATGLPSVAIPTINVSYGKEASTALRAAAVVERLRKAGVPTSDPVPVPRLERSSIRIYFPPDRDMAEAMRSRAGNGVESLAVELAPAGPSTRPGQIDLLFGDRADQGHPTTTRPFATVRSED